MNTTSTTVPKNIVPDAPKRERTSRGLPRAVGLFLSKKLRTWYSLLSELLIKLVVPAILYVFFSGVAFYFLPWSSAGPIKYMVAIGIGHFGVEVSYALYNDVFKKWIAEIKRLSKEKP